MPQSIIQMIVALVVIGLGLWLLTSFVPIDPMILKLIYAVIVVGVLIWVLRLSGLWGGTPTA